MSNIKKFNILKLFLLTTNKASWLCKSNLANYKYKTNGFYTINLTNIIQQLQLVFYSIILNNINRICFLCADNLSYIWSKHLGGQINQINITSMRKDTLSVGADNFVFCYNIQNHIKTLGFFKRGKWLTYGFLYPFEYTSLIDYYFILNTKKFIAIYWVHLLLKKFLRLRYVN